MAESVNAENPLEGYIQRQLEMNSSAGMLYEIFGTKLGLFAEFKPEVIKSVKNISTDVWLWTFVDVGCGTWKHSVKCDEQTTSVTWTLLEGAVPQILYNALKVEYHFSLKGEGCKVTVTLTYKKKNITVPVPDVYMDVICDLVVVAAKKSHKH